MQFLVFKIFLEPFLLQLYIHFTSTLSRDLRPTTPYARASGLLGYSSTHTDLQSSTQTFPDKHFASQVLLSLTTLFDVFHSDSDTVCGPCQVMFNSSLIFSTKTTQTCQPPTTAPQNPREVAAGSPLSPAQAKSTAPSIKPIVALTQSISSPRQSHVLNVKVPRMLRKRRDWIRRELRRKRSDWIRRRRIRRERRKRREIRRRSRVRGRRLIEWEWSLEVLEGGRLLVMESLFVGNDLGFSLGFLAWLWCRLVFMH
jgi:hypothetical protein